jgi:hypothetical protein
VPLESSLGHSSTNHAGRDIHAPHGSQAIGRIRDDCGYGSQHDDIVKAQLLKPGHACLVVIRARGVEADEFDAPTSHLWRKRGVQVGEAQVVDVGADDGAWPLSQSDGALDMHATHRSAGAYRPRLAARLER